MAKTELRYEPDYAISPGATLRSTLVELGMKQADLAVRTGLSLKHINQIAQGIAAITHESALLLEKATGVPARIWNAREAHYRDHLARTHDTKVLVADAAWLDELPVRDLVRRGYLTKGADVGSRLQEVCRFFGVANRESWDGVWREPLAAFRKSPSFASQTGAVATWLRLGEIEAAEIDCEPFDAKRFRTILDHVRKLTGNADPGVFVPLLQKLCAEAGVAVVFVRELPGTRASGAARWLTPTKALIQLSLRHLSDDHLWFSFFHEAAHVLLHGKKELFIHEGSSGPQPLEALEREADAFATNGLIPRRFDSELDSLKTDQTIIDFAVRIGIAPGVVVGRLQHEGLVGWNQHNHLKQRFRWIEPEAS
ncbi:MAG: ImmA/IrrE family metallo-endopeptidase [Actinomycetota bacterium]